LGVARSGWRRVIVVRIIIPSGVRIPVDVVFACRTVIIVDVVALLLVLVIIAVEIIVIVIVVVAVLLAVTIVLVVINSTVAVTFFLLRDFLLESVDLAPWLGLASLALVVRPRAGKLGLVRLRFATIDRFRISRWCDVARLGSTPVCCFRPSLGGPLRFLLRGSSLLSEGRVVVL
jgi:hypothetical protein